MDRRQFLAGAAGLTAAATVDRTFAQTPTVPPAKTVRTNVLEIGYRESGPASGFPVFLLHGFPDDAHAYDGVAPVLAKAGYRAFAVYLRGFGPTRFLDPSAPRTAQQAAIGQDIIDLADALNLQRVALCGYDWGGRASCITAALHPDRVRAAVLCGGYSIQNTITPRPPASPASVRNAWYQWYFNTEVGREGLTKNRAALCRYMWQQWSPTWTFTDAIYDLTAASFENPDFVDCVLHSYRHRNFNAPGEPRFVETEKLLATRPKVQVPTIVLHGGDDGFGKPAPETTESERIAFPRLVARRVVAGAGHFVPHEQPEAVAAALVDVLAASR
ncbi:MAG TPA: alpha/beta hydrolase [Vicinamibacterales bacterium]|nr:alpha/beta hydrolase [Vicinamibacterales bacterium]